MKTRSLREARPDIFSYHDYRLFLREYFAYWKTRKTDFSLRALAREVGVSPSYFTMVLKGGAPLSVKLIPSLGTHLCLSQEEQSFFAHLIDLIEARDLSEQKQAFKRLSKFGLYKSRHQVELLAHQYFSNWYYVAIRELANRKDFKPDPKWINQRLERKISTSDVREALEFLITHKFIREISRGSFQASQNNINCEGPLYRLALTEFYKQTYDLCIESIFKTPNEERYLTSHSMAVSEEGFKAVRNVLQEAVGKLQAITASENETEAHKRVYHVSFAGIPWTKKEGF
jgi:uncharacterized protein (TIGR02147 family)